MKTSLESAQKWITHNQPNLSEIELIITKLEGRIHQWQGKSSAIQGSLDALNYLLNYVADQKTKNITDDELSLDHLIPEGTPICLDKATKKQRFTMLKNQFGINLDNSQDKC